MLLKINRVNKKGIDLLFKEGKSINSLNLNFKFILNFKTGAPQISFIAPKGIAKLAVKRNLLRRLGYRVLGSHIKEFPAGLIGVFIFKKYEESITTLENEIKNVVNKIN